MTASKDNYRFYYSDGKNWIVKEFSFDECLNGLPIDVMCDIPLLRDYKLVRRVQSTGLTDIHDVEIFDREWIKNKMGRICEVVWHPHEGSYDARFEADENYVDGADMAHGFEPSMWTYSVEVIGNYDMNPWPLEITYE